MTTIDVSTLVTPGLPRPACHRAWPLALLVLVAGCEPPEPATTLRASGYVEATETRVAAEVGGRLLRLHVDEGDVVSAGQQLAELDTRDTDLSLERAHAERDRAQADLRLLLAGAREEDIRQAEAQVRVAEAQLAAARLDSASAEADFDRFEGLLRAEAGSRKARDDASTRLEVSRQQVAAAEQTQRASQERLERLRRGARPEEIAAARARVAASDATIAMLEKAREDAVVVAPAAGVITEKLTEAGEILPPAAPLLVLTDLDHAWANVYVEEPFVPRLRLGQPATILTDAPDVEVSGTITYISSEAEFTPRNVQTVEERSRLVYRVKIDVDNRAGILKPGMPVDAEVALSEPAAAPTPDQRP